ncbi:hypothetical protein [Lusitaniella coriacea]|uniref:hypothetical protein n=1 Tax=Lusitaniella coriacea TaxID=1983105 RepID=UPI003CE6F501
MNALSVESKGAGEAGGEALDDAEKNGKLEIQNRNVSPIQNSGTRGWGVRGASIWRIDSGGKKSNENDEMEIPKIRAALWVCDGFGRRAVDICDRGNRLSSRSRSGARGGGSSHRSLAKYGTA